MSPGKKVYAIKFHVRDLPARFTAWDRDPDGFLWLGNPGLRGSWLDARTYPSEHAAKAAAGSVTWRGETGAVPGRYTLVTMDTVVVGEEVRTVGQ